MSVYRVFWEEDNREQWSHVSFEGHFIGMVVFDEDEVFSSRQQAVQVVVGVGMEQGVGAA